MSFPSPQAHQPGGEAGPSPTKLEPSHTQGTSRTLQSAGGTGPGPAGAAGAGRDRGTGGSSRPRKSGGAGRKILRAENGGEASAGNLTRPPHSRERASSRRGRRATSLQVRAGQRPLAAALHARQPAPQGRGRGNERRPRHVRRTRVKPRGRGRGVIRIKGSGQQGPTTKSVPKSVSFLHPATDGSEHER